ncbi:cytochrome C biogenesis protein [Heyndrickxia ginsengihumi]|uniref:Cytochrome C biogenesis protein n=1 Tax=Heyndrickxia ginsengihumi TaxID=363870 RepID=A0A0A6VE16_9BACI|nr:cytochrome c biogenesis protein ResB [Heyndrickxia ginsengihumi]KHD85806.1 cytochrome C biogenesis protein [Heyndrickxia ginsengihumi]
MNAIKCECGHVNPIGTILCEACGSPLTEEAKKQQLYDMRYEGSGLRSKTYHKTIVDEVWNFFSSVKIGVIFIVLTLIATAVGTIFPQQNYIPSNIDPASYYKQEYRIFGELWYKLGFQNLYGSWWYLLLIAMIGVSLVICSLDRFIPLRRALQHQKVSKHAGFFKKQRLYAEKEGLLDDHTYFIIIEKLKAKHYHIREEDGNLLAEKNRFSRWGPYVNHIGLIIFLIGCMLRSVPGMYVDELVWIREGEKKVLPGTQNKYVLQNRHFTVQVYSKKHDNHNYSAAITKAGKVAKNFQTDVVLYKQNSQHMLGENGHLQKIKSFSIQVNKPLTFDHYAIYQSDYKLHELYTMTFALENKHTQRKHGTITINLYNPKEVYLLENGYQVNLLGYYPSFTGFAKNGEPQTNSYIPNNPAFIFSLVSPMHPEGEKSFVSIQKTIEPSGNNDFKLKFVRATTRNVSALTVRKDLTLWFLAVGGAIFMIGVVQGAYWNHRRIWLKRENCGMAAAAHTNKNWFGFQRELRTIFSEVNIDFIDQHCKKINY